MKRRVEMRVEEGERDNSIEEEEEEKEEEEEEDQEYE